MSLPALLNPNVWSVLKEQANVIVASGFFSLKNLGSFDASRLLVPYGVVLFSYLATSAIPEVKEVMSGHLKQMKRAIVIGSLIPIAVYVLFAGAVVGATALGTTEVATIGLGVLLGAYTTLAIALLIIFLVATAFGIHHFWTDADPMQKMGEKTNFFKNWV